MLPPSQMVFLIEINRTVLCECTPGWDVDLFDCALPNMLFVLCICVFLFLVFVFLVFVFSVLVSLTHGNVIFDILEQPSFQKYTTCWVFLALCHMLYLCICVFVFFVFVRLTHQNIIFDILEQSAFQKYTTCWVFLALYLMLYSCICVFCTILCTVSD